MADLPSSMAAPYARLSKRKAAEQACKPAICLRAVEARGSLPLENFRDRLEAVARVVRQAGADRIAGVERAVAGEHLGRDEIAQHWHLRIFLLLLEQIGIDRQHHEGRGDRAPRIGRVPLEYREKVAELHDLVDVNDALLERADDG